MEKLEFIFTADAFVVGGLRQTFASSFYQLRQQDR